MEDALLELGTAVVLVLSEEDFMQMCRRILSVALAVMLATSTAWAQQAHVITQSALDHAVQQRVTQDQADRDAIHELLRNPAVKDVAARTGLSIEKADAAVSTLQGDELHQLAGQARAASEQLAGGASTITITTTTLIIILLVVILLVVALK